LHQKNTFQEQIKLLPLLVLYTLLHIASTGITSSSQPNQLIVQRRAQLSSLWSRDLKICEHVDLS